MIFTQGNLKNAFKTGIVQNFMDAQVSTGDATIEMFPHF